VVKSLSKKWWIPIGGRPEGSKLEPEGPRIEVGFPTADQGFSSIQGTLVGFYGIQIVFDACNIYLHQAWTNANDKMTVNDYIFYTKHHAYRKKNSNINCADWWIPAKRCQISIVGCRICY